MRLRGKRKARNFFGKPSQPRPSVCLLCFTVVYSCQGRPGVQSESSALQSPEGAEVIYCFPLQLPLPCSIWSTTPLSAMLGGTGSFSLHWKGNGSKRAEKLLQLLQDDTKKAEEGKRFSETRTERQVENVRLDGVYLSNPSYIPI